MSLKRDEYWWIEDKHGKLITVGRTLEYINIEDIKIIDYGIPEPTLTKRESKELCREGENPVKVKLVKVKP